MAKATCLGCTKRHVGCHSKCEKYQAFIAENERIKKRKAKEELYRRFKAACIQDYRKYEMQHKGGLP